jgi:hypothetical protein
MLIYVTGVLEISVNTAVYIMGDSICAFSC